MHQYLHFRPVQIITGHVIYNSQYKICIDQVKVALVIMQENMKPSGPLGHTNAVEFTKKNATFDRLSLKLFREIWRTSMPKLKLPPTI